MDIGAIGNSTLSSITQNAASTSARSADDDFAKKLEAAVQNNDEKELKKACQEFEGIVLDMLYKQMKATIVKSDLLEEDPGTDIFESMLDDQLMEQASKTGSLGLAESLYKQLSKQYGRQEPGSSGENKQKSGNAIEEVEME